MEYLQIIELDLVEFIFVASVSIVIPFVVTVRLSPEFVNLTCT